MRSGDLVSVRPAGSPAVWREGCARLRPGTVRAWGMRALVLAVLALAAFLLWRTLSNYALDQVAASIGAIPPGNLALAAGFAAASYFCLTGFDALAVRYAGRRLPYRSVALASFVSVSVGHNIGFSTLGSGAIRFRFYSRLGLRAREIAELILFCATTVGLGVTVLVAAALLLRPGLAQDITGLDRAVVLAFGALCLVLALGYLGLAAAARRPLRLGRSSLRIPSLRLALAQIILGPLNFALVAASLHQVLAATADVSYLQVAIVYVIAIVAALISQVPGGLGVVEGVVLLLVPEGEIIGALVMFRLVYFLVPLGLGGLLFAWVELAPRGWRAGYLASGGRIPVPT